MAWWAYLLLALVLFLIVRWVLVRRALRAQLPSAMAIAEAGELMISIRTLMDYGEAYPDMDVDERDDGLRVLQDVNESLIRLMRRNINSGALVYLRHFLDVTELVYDFYRKAPYDPDDHRDNLDLMDIFDRWEAIQARGEAIIANNPTPSLLRVLFLGVPKVKPID